MTPFGEGEQLPVRVYEGAEEVDMSEKQEQHRAGISRKNRQQAREKVNVRVS